MRKFSKIFAVLLSVCIIATIVAVFSSAAAPAEKTEVLRSYDFETIDDIPTGTSNGGAGTYADMQVVKNEQLGNSYFRYSYKKAGTASYNRAIFLAHKTIGNTRLSDYSYYTVDFDIAADQYRYQVLENGETVEKLSTTMPTIETESNLVEGSVRLAYSNYADIKIDNRGLNASGTSLGTSGVNAINIRLIYNETDKLWHINAGSKDTGYTLSDTLGEWNHFTYAIKTVAKTLDDGTVTYGYSQVKLYYNGQLLGTSNINTSSTNIKKCIDVSPYVLNFGVIHKDYADEAYSIALDNFKTTFYKKGTDGYTSGDKNGIDDLFDGKLTYLVECEDVVYNIDYKSPAPNKYAVIDNKEVYNPILAAKLLSPKSGDVIETGIDLIGIDVPAWTSFTINCDEETNVTLSNESIARGITLKKTDTGYAVGAGIKANMSLFTDMRFNLYLPKIDGIAIKSVEGANLASSTYWVNGTEMFVVWTKLDIDAFDPIEAKIKYTFDNKEYELNIMLDVLAYASGVAKTYECGSKEAKLIYEIISYKESVATYLNPEFSDKSGKLEAFKALYSSHDDCSCTKGEPEISAEEIKVDYSELIDKGVTGISYQLSLNEIGMVIYVNKDVAVSSVSYKNALGETVTHTVEDGSLVKENGYYFVKNVSAANIKSIMTITVGSASGTYSLGCYIHNNPGIKVAKSLYTYSMAAENYKSTIIPYKASHLILNEDGSYGGTLSESLYGNGAPLNGKYDVDNSDYYTVNNDYYNMSSTSERIIFPQFSSYQQTMQDSSGLACLMMILNYMGEDVRGEYSELALVKKYQELNNTTVYGNGTTAEGLKKLIESLDLGYTSESSSLVFSSSDSKKTKQTKMKNFFNDNIKAGKFVLVRYQSPTGYGWKVVIGYDNLGNIQNTLTEEFVDSFTDDVIIFAEPYDGADHCQDGYATERAQDFLVWWRDMAIDGTLNETYSYLVIDPNLDIEFDYQPVDETVKQELYDIHLPLNPDGTYGGTRNEDLYGPISSGRGWYNHTDSNYYKINDFYNMGSYGTRLLLTKYTVFQQTMYSSCGICAVTSVLKYYGAEGSYYDMELDYLNDYERLNADEIAEEGPVYGRGTTTQGHLTTLAEWGYTDIHTGSFYKGKVPVFPTYQEYVAFIREQLLAGRPIVVSTNLGSGHFLTIIGYDDMGTDYIYDDVIITADSNDVWDGYQDGYNVFSAYKFFRQHTTSSYNWLQVHYVIYNNKE